MDKALDGFSGKDRLLYHCRTGTLIDPESLIDLYRDFARRGISRIVTAEHIRFSPETGHFPDIREEGFFRYRKTRSGLTAIHNYPRLMAEAGYGLEDRVLIPELSFRNGNQLALGEMVGLCLFERCA